MPRSKELPGSRIYPKTAGQGAKHDRLIRAHPPDPGHQVVRFPRASSSVRLKGAILRALRAERFGVTRDGRHNTLLCRRPHDPLSSDLHQTQRRSSAQSVRSARKKTYGSGKRLAHVKCACSRASEASLHLVDGSRQNGWSRDSSLPCRGPMPGAKPPQFFDHRQASRGRANSRTPHPAIVVGSPDAHLSKTWQNRSRHDHGAHRNVLRAERGGECASKN